MEKEDLFRVRPIAGREGFYTIKPEKGPLPREFSMGTFNAYAGTAKDLYERTEAGTARMCTRACSGHGACLIIEPAQYFYMVKNCVIIWHSPRGCPMWGVFIQGIVEGAERMSGEKVSKHKVFTCDLSSNEIVYSGEDKLRETILWCDKRYEPDIIAIFISCASGIIGDNVDGIVDSIRDKVKATMVVLHSEGYRSRIWSTAFDLGAYAWVKDIMQEPERKEEGLINVIGPWTANIRDFQEVDRLLKKAGIKARYYPKFVTREDIRKAPEAVGNAMMCASQGLPLMEYMRDRFGIPFSRCNQITGIEATRSWLMGAAELVGKEKEMEKVIEEEEQELMQRLEPLKKVLKGKRVYCSGSHARGPHLAKICLELGMEVVGMTFFYWDKVVNPNLKNLIDACGGNIITLVNPAQVNEELPVVRYLKPDLYMGDAGVVATPAMLEGVPVISIQPATKKGLRAGYNGVYAFAREMALCLLNSNFYRRTGGKYYRVHKESWMEGNPFRFIPKDMNLFSSEKSIDEILKKVSTQPSAISNTYRKA